VDSQQAPDFFKKKQAKKIKFEKAKMGPKFFPTPPEGLFANKEVFLLTKRPLTLARGHPARPTGGMPIRPPLYKPPPALKLLFYSAKISKKKKERRGRE
jgi:hypothetical protein